MNEKGETAKLLKVVDISKLQAEEAMKTVKEKQKVIEAKEQEIATIKEAAERSNVINELTQPLNTEQKEIMNNLLESVQTGALRKQFEKYIPSVLNGRTPAKKQAINEGTEVTGDKQINIVNSNQFNSNIVDIRRLAGI